MPSSAGPTRAASARARRSSDAPRAAGRCQRRDARPGCEAVEGEEAIGGGLIGEANPRIEPGVGGVSEEVERAEEGAIHDDDAAEEEDVAVDDGVDEEASGAGQIEHGFDHDGPGEEVGSEGAEEGDDGEDGDFEGVAVGDGAFGEAFGAGGSDEVLSEDFEEGGAGEACDVGDGGSGEGESGEDDALRGVPATDGKERKFDGEEEGEQGACDEHGKAQQGEGGEHGGGIGPRAFAGGGEGAEPDTGAGGHEESGEAEGEGDGQALSDEFVDGAVAVFGGDAELSGGEVGEVTDELGGDGAIELVFGGELLLDDGREFAFTGERTARREADEQEGDRDDAQQDREGASDAAEEEREHLRER